MSKSVQTLNVKVQTPRQILFEGQALSVSSKDSQGKFDLLAQHANFIAIIQKYPIDIVKVDKQKITINVNQAIIHLKQNYVSIYVDPQTV